MKPITREMLVADLAPAPYNPREISEPALAGLRASIERWGLVEPIVWNERTRRVVGGHQRLKVLEAAGELSTLVVVVDLPEDEEKALNVTLNNPEIAGTWTAGVLPILEEIRAALGEAADALRIDDLRAAAERCLREAVRRGGLGSAGEDEVPEPSVECITRPGDLWWLGSHRLLCGDCTHRADVERVMAGEKADLCFTDPPYGVGWAYETHHDSQSALSELIASFFPLAREHASLIALTPGLSNMWEYERPDWVLCWFYAAGTGRSPWGYTAWQPIMVWGKCPKLSAGEGSHPDGFQFMMSQDDAAESRLLSHSCPKPLSVWRRFMERLTNSNSRIVYDPFCGSGTTLVAAEQLGLRCNAIEISEKYVDVTVRRWEGLTGRKAVLQPREEAT